MLTIIKSIDEAFTTLRNFNIYLEEILVLIGVMFILRNMIIWKRMTANRAKWITVLTGIPAQFAWVNLNLSLQDIARQILLGMFTGVVGVVSYYFLKEYKPFQKLINKVSNGKKAEGGNGGE